MEEKDLKEFEKVVKPVIKFLSENCNPHVQIIVSQTNAEMVVGQFSTGEITDYLKD